MTEADGQEFQRSSAALKDLSGRLWQLVSEFEGEDDASSDERNLADGVRALVERLGAHADRLQVWHEATRQASAQASATDRATMQCLAGDIRRNQRRMLQSKAELRLLTSLDGAKAFDHSMSDRYERRAQGICSDVRAKAMAQKTMELQHEVAALQHE